MPTQNEAKAAASYVWRQVTDNAGFPGRDGAGALVFDDKMWLLGGWNPGDKRTNPIHSNCNNEVWSTADGRAWKLHADHVPWTPRVCHDVAVFDGRLWLLEGQRVPGGNGNDVWHSADGARWQDLPGTPWAPRHAASVFVFRDALWMAAGNHMGRDVWKLERNRPG